MKRSANCEFTLKFKSYLKNKTVNVIFGIEENATM